MTSTTSSATAGYADKMARELVQGLVAGDMALTGSTPGAPPTADATTSPPAQGGTGSPGTPAATPDLSAVIAEVMAGLDSTPSTPSRDLPVPAGTPGPTSGPAVPTVGGDSEAQQRFFGSLLQAVLPVVQQVAPLVLQAIQGRRRELGLPEQRDPEVDQRDLGEVLSGLLNHIVPALSPLVSQLLNRRDLDPNDTEDVQQRFFFPLLASLIPAAVQALPGIISAVSGGRDLSPVDLTSDDAAGERFFGSFLPQLAGGLLQQLPTILQAFRARDLPEVPSGEGAAGADQDSEEQQRFFGALFQALVPVVASAVPHILQAVQGQRRDLGLPEDRDAESVQRDFGAIFSGLLGQVVNVLPQIISSFGGRRDFDASNPEDAQQRFIFPLLAALIPAAAQAIPAIVNAVSGGREVNRALEGDVGSQQRFLSGILGPFITNCFGQLSRPQTLQTLLPVGGRDVEPVTDPDEQQRFFGALLPTLLPTLMSTVPSILQAIQGRRRALGMADEQDVEAVQRGIVDAIGSFVSEATAIFENPSVLLQQAVDDIASVVRQIGPEAAREQVQQRFFFPLLASLIPAAVQAVPAIINAVSGGRRDLDPGEVLADAEAGQRFFGSLITTLAGGLAQHLPGLLQTLAGAQRDLPAAAGSTQADDTQTAAVEDQDRFLGGLLSALVPVVVNAVPAVLQAIQGQRRDLGQADESDPAALERDIGSILSGLLGQVVNVLPQVVDLFANRRDFDVQNGEEVQERFLFPLLGLLIPAAAQAIPAIIGAVSGNRDVSGVVDVTDREVAERFFGPLVGQLVGGLVQNLPQILQVFSNRPREFQLNWINFTGQWLPDHDVVRTVETDLGDPGWIEIQIEQPYGSWWKGVAVWIGGTRVREVGVQDNNRVSDVIRVPTGDLAGAGWVQLLKAKAFGAHTPMYAIAGLEQKAGKRITFRWEHS